MSFPRRAFLASAFAMVLVISHGTQATILPHHNSSSPLPSPCPGYIQLDFSQLFQHPHTGHPSVAPRHDAIGHPEFEFLIIQVIHCADAPTLHQFERGLHLDAKWSWNSLRSAI